MEQNEERKKSIDDTPGQNHTGQSSRDNAVDYSEHRQFVQTRNIIYYLLGIVEVLLGFRLVFKLLGASTTSGFVVFVYSLTRIFAAPFFGIFNTVVNKGTAGQFVFEPATVIAMIVYAIIARGLVNLAKLRIVENAHK